MAEKEFGGIDMEEMKVKGSQLVDKFREIVEEGNARRISIRKDGKTVMEFPLSVGVGGATAAILLSPTLAAVGAFASLVSDVQVVVERRNDKDAASNLIDPSGTAEPGGF